MLINPNEYRRYDSFDDHNNNNCSIVEDTVTSLSPNSFDEDHNNNNCSIVEDTVTSLSPNPVDPGRGSSVELYLDEVAEFLQAYYGGKYANTTYITDDVLVKPDGPSLEAMLVNDKAKRFQFLWAGDLQFVKLRGVKFPEYSQEVESYLFKIEKAFRQNGNASINSSQLNGGPLGIHKPQDCDIPLQEILVNDPQQRFKITRKGVKGVFVRLVSGNNSPNEKKTPTTKRATLSPKEANSPIVKEYLIKIVKFIKLRTSQGKDKAGFINTSTFNDPNACFIFF